MMREEIMEAFKYLKIVKAHRPTEVYTEMILDIGDHGIRVLMEHCQRILDGKGMPEDRLPELQFKFCVENEMS